MRSRGDDARRRNRGRGRHGATHQGIFTTASGCAPCCRRPSRRPPGPRVARTARPVFRSRIIRISSRCWRGCGRTGGASSKWRSCARDLEDVFVKAVSSRLSVFGGDFLSGFRGLFHKEILRFWRVAVQTLLAPAATSFLYLLVFFAHFGKSSARFRGRFVYRFFGRRLDDDVDFAKLFRQQRVVARAIARDRQFGFCFAAADLAVRVFRRLRAGVGCARALRGGRRCWRWACFSPTI